MAGAHLASVCRSGWNRAAQIQPQGPAGSRFEGLGEANLICWSPCSDNAPPMHMVALPPPPRAK